MNLRCKVTLLSHGRGLSAEKCGKDVVNIDRRLCVKHEADRIRLGGRP